MIRDIDIQQAKEINMLLQKMLIQRRFVNKEEDNFNWDIANKMELIDRMVSNLQKAPFSYHPAPPEDIKANFYTAICDKCGWWGSSKLLDGGGQIADTGDYGDCYCPVCGNANTGEVEEAPAKVCIIGWDCDRYGKKSDEECGGCGWWQTMKKE